MGNVACKMTEYGWPMMLYSSILNLVAIAIDRFFAVTRPLRYKLSSKWLVKVGIPAIWLSSALLPIDVALLSEVKNFDIDGDVRPICYYDKNSKVQFVLFAACLVASFIVLIVLYSIICYRLWKRNIPGEVSTNQHGLVVRTARKVTVLMISIVVIFVVSWAPEFGVILSNLNSDSYYESYPFLYAISHWLVLNSSACNPCLYFIFIESFREGLKAACSRCLAPQSRPCCIGQDRRFEPEESVRNRQASDVYILEEREIKLTAYSTSITSVAP